MMDGLIEHASLEDSDSNEMHTVQVHAENDEDEERVHEKAGDFRTRTTTRTSATASSDPSRRRCTPRCARRPATRNEPGYGSADCGRGRGSRTFVPASLTDRLTSFLTLVVALGSWLGQLAYRGTQIAESLRSSYLQSCSYHIHETIIMMTKFRHY